MSKRPEATQATAADENLPFDRRTIRTAIYFATRRTGTPLIDEDLLQESWLRILRAVKRDTCIIYPRAFAIKIVGDVVRDHWRRRRLIVGLDSIPDDQVSYLERFEARLDTMRDCNRLRGHWGRLPPKTQQAMELFYIEEWSIPDLASALHSSRSAVKMTLLRGRQALRKMMTAETNFNS